MKISQNLALFLGLAPVAIIGLLYLRHVIKSSKEKNEE